MGDKGGKGGLKATNRRLVSWFGFVCDVRDGWVYEEDLGW